MDASRAILTNQIEELAAQREAILTRLLDHEHGSPERLAEERALDAARRAEAAVRRELAARFGDEVVVPMLLGVEPSPSVSAAMLIQAEDDAVVLFCVASPPPPENEGVALLILKSTLQSRFGLPNDEALDGHPLREAGLEAYCCAEVLNSRWLAEVEQQNQRVFPTTTFSCRHFVFTFHDSMLEVLAEDATLELLRSYSAAMTRAMAIVAGTSELE